MRLEIDPSYQRPTANGSSHNLIRRIADRWDWRLCVPLLVARRGDALFVIDGQHRLEAARLRSDIPHLPCCISSYAGAAEEAQLFVAANRSRRPISRFDDHRAAVAAKDEEAVAVDEVIRDAGLSIATTTAMKAWKPGEIGCIAGVRTALRAHGRAVVSAALVNIAEAFPDEQMLYAGTLLGALYQIHKTPPPDFDPDRLFDALLSKTQAQWVQGLTLATGSVVYSEVRARILRAYANQAGSN